MTVIFSPELLVFTKTAVICCIIRFCLQAVAQSQSRKCSSESWRFLTMLEICSWLRISPHQSCSHSETTFIHPTIYIFDHTCERWKVKWAHLKLGNELWEDAEEGLSAGGLAVLPKVGGRLGELLHGLGLHGLQRLDCRMAVLQETLWMRKWLAWRAAVEPGADLCFSELFKSIIFIFMIQFKQNELNPSHTLITEAKWSSAVDGIFRQAVLMSWIVVWKSLSSAVMVLWFTRPNTETNMWTHTTYIQNIQYIHTIDLYVYICIPRMMNIMY